MINPNSQPTFPSITEGHYYDSRSLWRRCIVTTLAGLLSTAMQPAKLDAIPRPVDSSQRGQEPPDPMGNLCAIPDGYRPIGDYTRTNSDTVKGVDTHIKVLGMPPRILRPKRRLGPNFIQNIPGRITLRGSTEALSKIQSLEVFSCQRFEPVDSRKAIYSAPVRKASINDYQDIQNGIRGSIVMRERSLELNLAPTKMKCVGLRGRYFPASGIAAAFRFFDDPLIYVTKTYIDRSYPTGLIIRC